MKCPDCRFELTDDDIVDFMTGKDGEVFECEPYYKRPKCKSCYDFEVFE